MQTNIQNVKLATNFERKLKKQPISYSRTKQTFWKIGRNILTLEKPENYQLFSVYSFETHFSVVFKRKNHFNNVQFGHILVTYMLSISKRYFLSCCLHYKIICFIAQCYIIDTYQIICFNFFLYKRIANRRLYQINITLKANRRKF